ncbi:MAG: AMP-binding protein [Microscillaceae bacterium]|nr:AMP-binding protein [Microscillaceae bacterium]MDW8461402.1 AMP-binding protein [Cytophagales bacterium]
MEQAHTLLQEIVSDKAKRSGLKPITLLEKFYEWEKKQPNKVYLRQPSGNQWINYTWAEVGDQARRIATAINSLGLPPKSNIGIISKNCAHWIISDLAILMAGHVSVPFYPTLSAEQLNQVLNHSECKVLFIGKLDEPNWKAMKAGIPGNIQCITYPQYNQSAKIEEKGYWKWEDLLKKYEPKKDNHIPDLDDIFTIIYTSGTTGMPKGVMHSFYTSSIGIDSAAEILKIGSTEDRYFSYLPLCHIAERAIVESASIHSGGTVYFADTLESFAANLAEAQPTHFLAVPRIWTKFQMGILAKIPQKKLDLLLKIPILSSIIKKKIKKKLGLSKAKVILTGAAPMPPALLSWYHKLGIYIQEAYGMTENNGECTLMRLDKVKMGTVGQPYPGVQLKIDKENNNEILMKAEWVMVGYYKEPGKTAETIQDGWLRTGDSGEIDEEGFLKITGRVKDTFKGAKGEFIVPGPIEAGFATNTNIEQVCIVGRGLPQPIALVVLSEFGKNLDKIAITESLEATRKAINQKLVHYERVEKVVVVKEPWTIENGLLTPTLKIRRNILEEKYEGLLQKWYEKSDSVIWE